ncbi:MAG: hypothetical protein E6612_05375 [Paeniclostridium sordellii]|nr:hypothetical protein [Paeniclostridium sordellii]
MSVLEKVSYNISSKLGRITNKDEDEIEVMIIDIKNKEKRMVVSLKEANKEPEEDYSEFLETEESLGSLGELFKEKFKDLK